MLFLLDTKSIPTLGCISPCPAITKFFFSFNSGLFKICAIAPINSNPEFKTKFVSASSVIIYFISGICFPSIEFALNGFLILPNKYSLN